MPKSTSGRKKSQKDVVTSDQYLYSYIMLGSARRVRFLYFDVLMLW